MKANAFECILWFLDRPGRFQRYSVVPYL